MRDGEVRRRRQRLEEEERVPDVVDAAVLRIAAVRHAVGRRGEVAADVARGRPVAERHVREAAREALRHEHDDADARAQALGQPAELGDRQRIAHPERDRVAVPQVLVVLRPVIGHVDEKRVPGVQVVPRLLEPALDAPLRGVLQLPAGNPGVLVDDRLPELGLDARALEEPEVRIDLQLADGEVGRGIGAVGAEDGDAVGWHAGTPDQVEELADVEQVRLVVLRGGAAPVDQEDVQALRGGRMQLSGRPRLTADEECDEEKR
jgi:hypothetical protein